MSNARDYRNAKEVLLADATVQEIQLELIRRTQFNAFDGEKVVRTLLGHKELWSAVLLDRLYVWTNVDLDLPMSGMIKLRDLPKGYWNADTLYILTEVEKAKALCDVIAADEWAAEVAVHDQPDVVLRTLGTGRPGYAIVRAWWD